MERKWKYSASDSMSELVEDNYHALLVMSRFGIGLGFGNKSIREICEAHTVDPETFLAVVNIMLDYANTAVYDASRVSTESLLDYLTKSHDYFLKFRLPAIRKELVEVMSSLEGDLSKALIRYFDEYVAEMRYHTRREDKAVFPYVRSLVRGESGKTFRLDNSHSKHDRLQSRLAEFKRILIKYYPAQSSNELNGVLFDIYTYEYDLMAHNRVEDRLLIPIIADLERKNDGKA